MKKTILIFVLLSLPLLSFGQSPTESCGINTSMDDLVQGVFGEKCLSLEGDEKCACLKNEISKSVLLQELDKENTVKQYQKKLREDRTEIFWSVYSQMNQGADFQQAVLNNDTATDNEKVVGCTPAEMTKSFRSKLEDHVGKEKKLQKKLVQELQTEFDQCSKNNEKVSKGLCKMISDKIAKLSDDVKADKNLKIEVLCGQAVDSNTKAAMNASLQNSINWFNKFGKDNDEEKEKIKKLRCYQLLIGDHSDEDRNEFTRDCTRTVSASWIDIDHSDTVMEQVKSFTMSRGYPEDSISTGHSVETNKAPISISHSTTSNSQDQAHGDSVGCDLKSANMIEIAEYTQKINTEILDMDHEHEMLHAPVKDCRNNDPTCLSFENRNNKTLEGFATKFAKDDKYCITYPNFLIRKGVPGDDFLKELASASDKDVSKLLFVPKTITTKADEQRLQFLRGNPLLSKAATNPAIKEKIALGLKSMALANSTKDYADKLDAYLNFMKVDLPKIVDKNSLKNIQANLCEKMVENFTNIQVATDLPELKTNQGGFRILDAIRSCKIDENNGTSVTNVTEALKFDDLFRKVEGYPEPKEEDQYLAMNKEQCAGWEKAKLKCAKVNDDCRKVFRADSAGNKKIEAVMAGHKVGGQLSTEAVKRVVNNSRESYQDKSYKSVWKKKVGSKMAKSTVPYKGQEDVYNADRARDSEIAASADKIISPQKTPSRVAEAPGIQSPASAINPGQILPSYADSQAPVVNPAQISPEKSVTNAIPNFNNLPPEQKIEGLNQVKDYLSKNNLDPDAYDLEDQLAAAKTENAKIQKEIAKLSKPSGNRIMAPTPAASNTVGPTFNTDVNRGIASVASPSFSGSPVSSANTASVSQASRSASAINDALIKSNERKVSGQAQVIVKSGVVGDKDLPSTGLEVSTEFTADSASQFEAISKDQGALSLYLKSHLNESDIGSGKIIMIKDPTNVSPGSNLIFMVKIENGKYVVQSMPADRAIARSSSTLQNLKRNLKIN